MGRSCLKSGRAASIPGNQPAPNSASRLDSHQQASWHPYCVHASVMYHVFVPHTRMHLLATFWIAAALSGCGPFVHRPVIAGDLKPSPLVPRLPAAVGVYYAPAFAGAEFERTESYPGGLDHNYFLSVGPPSVQFFDRVLAGMFDEVAHVDEMRPTVGLLARPRVIGLLAPSIDDFFFSVSRIDGHTECRVDPDGWARRLRIARRNRSGPASAGFVHSAG